MCTPIYIYSTHGTIPFYCRARVQSLNTKYTIPSNCMDITHLYIHITLQPCHTSPVIRGRVPASTVLPIPVGISAVVRFAGRGTICVGKRCHKWCKSVRTSTSTQSTKDIQGSEVRSHAMWHLTCVQGDWYSITTKGFHITQYMDPKWHTCTWPFSCILLHLHLLVHSWKGKCSGVVHIQ